jgi:hypothetical protein
LGWFSLVGDARVGEGRRGIGLHPTSACRIPATRIELLSSTVCRSPMPTTARRRPA